MTLFLPFPKAAILVPSGSADDPDRKHLFILLTKPFGKPPEVLMVSISSIHPGRPHDASCILQRGDHSFIRHPSFVLYAKAEIVSAEKLIAGVQDGRLLVKEPLRDDIMARVVYGLETSRFVTPKVREFYRQAK